MHGVQCARYILIIIRYVQGYAKMSVEDMHVELVLPSALKAVRYTNTAAHASAYDMRRCNSAYTVNAKGVACTSETSD